MCHFARAMIYKQSSDLERPGHRGLAGNVQELSSHGRRESTGMQAAWRESVLGLPKEQKYHPIRCLQEAFASIDRNSDDSP